MEKNPEFIFPLKIKCRYLYYCALISCHIQGMETEERLLAESDCLAKANYLAKVGKLSIES